MKEREISCVPYKTKVYDFVIRIGKEQSTGDVTASGAMAISVTKEELGTLLKRGKKHYLRSKEIKRND